MEELIKQFNERGVRYLVIGGQAARLEGVPRFSMDWDLYIPPHDKSNLALINTIAGKEFDFPLLPLGPRGENCIQTYQTRWGIIQFHLGAPGLPRFEDAETRCVYHSTENGLQVTCISGSDLLAAKEAVNRPQDQIDIEFLRAKRNAGLL